MRESIRALVERLQQHAALCGISPPVRALRRYAVLRALDASWWLASKMDEERRELLHELAYRLRLHEPPKGTPICSADLPRGFPRAAGLADWPDAPLLVSLDDLAG